MIHKSLSFKDSSNLHNQAYLTQYTPPNLMKLTTLANLKQKNKQNRREKRYNHSTTYI